jgi:hypothetical protein
MESSHKEEESSAEQVHESSHNLPSEGNNIPEDTESQEESQIHNENLFSRFYRKDFPDENDIVIVSNYSSYLLDRDHQGE